MGVADTTVARRADAILRNFILVIDTESILKSELSEFDEENLGRYVQLIYSLHYQAW